MAIITISVDRVSNLANSDIIGKSDPYVKIELKQDVSVF
jgi:Ca2+-dependent lipid-binding protein